MNSPKLTRQQLEKLVKNPHYRLSVKQEALLNEYLKADQPKDKTHTQDVVQVHTQEIRPTDTNVTTVKVKKREGSEDAHRSTMPIEDLHS